MISRHLFFAFVGLLVIGIVDVGVWNIACQHLEAGWRKAVMAGRAQGLEGGAESLHWSGWPFDAEIVLDQVRLRGSSDAFPPNLDWTADRLRLRVSVFNPTELQLVPEGRQSIAMAGVPKTEFTAALIRVEVNLTRKDPAKALARNLSVELPSGAVNVAQVGLEFPADTIVASLSGVALPGIVAPIETLDARLSAEPLFPRKSTSSASARAWRDAGGQVKVAQAQLHWDGLDASLTGSGGLDTALQPDGSGEVTTNGLPQFLDRLAAIGAIPAPSALAAKAVLALLAPPGVQVLRLPLSVHAGIVTLARFPLLRLAPMDWN